VTKLAEAYVAAGARDVEVQIYDQARHEVFNETNRAEVRADLLMWLEGRLQGANA
jgi:alpha-beta hydrolase superfamily lysophospholipase